MAKAQTDIRSTSYDVWNARPNGYEGTFDEVLAQIKAEPELLGNGLQGRAELLHFLGVDKRQFSGVQIPRKLHWVDFASITVEDDSVVYGAPEDGASKWSIEYAQGRGWLNGPAKAALDMDPSN